MGSHKKWRAHAGAEDRRMGPELNELRGKLERLEHEVKVLSKRGAGMLSSADFLRLVITGDAERAKKAFWNRDWASVDHKFIIAPFNPEHLTPFSYDLAIGAEVYSCTKSVVTHLASDGDGYLMGPRETVVIKTEEFVALPPDYSATVWPRFRMPTESLFQSMVKIDPTWYGELGVAVTNLSPGEYPIRRGETFATLILYELRTPTGMYLYRRENVPEAKELDLTGKGLDIDRIEQGLRELRDLCEVTNGKLRLKKAPSGESFIKLLDIDPSANWREVITEAIGSLPHTMNGLGLTTLEMIRPNPAKVRRLTKESVQETKCGETELENAAIEHGVPFGLLAALPDFILEQVEKTMIPRVEAEVGARLFPQIVQLTLRVMALLSLVGVLVAVTRGFLQLEGNWFDIFAVGVILALFVVVVLLPFRCAPHTYRSRLKQRGD
jgi:deoxycytidine triphosphate deaminase